jgi:hypothetical protein
MTDLSLGAGHALISHVLCLSWGLLPPDFNGYSGVSEDQHQQWYHILQTSASYCNRDKELHVKHNN